jgi:hypothetical protein
MRRKGYRRAVLTAAASAAAAVTDIGGTKTSANTPDILKNVCDSAC